MTSISTQRDFAVACFDFTIPEGFMVSPGRTGATWQAETVHELERRGRLDRGAALRRMTQRYIEHMHTNEPVHTWSP